MQFFKRIVRDQMAAAAEPVMNWAARVVEERINQYRHGLLKAGLLLCGRRLGLHRDDRFSRWRRVLGQRGRAPAFSGRAIAGGLLYALSARPRLFSRVPGRLLFEILPGSLY